MIHILKKTDDFDKMMLYCGVCLAIIGGVLLHLHNHLPKLENSISTPAVLIILGVFSVACMFYIVIKKKNNCNRIV